MALNRIINRAIEANAAVSEKFANSSVITSKIADGSITESKFTTDTVNSVASLRFVNVTGPSGSGYTDLNAVETVTINGSGFQAGARVFLDEIEVAQANVTFVSQNAINFIVPRLTPSTYHVYVFNPDGGSVVKPIGLQFVSPPIWQTVSITSATQYNFYSTTVVATSLETLTYNLAGAMPQGLSLTTGGTISGYPIASPGSYFIGVTAKTASGVENTRYFTLNLAAGSFVANVDVLTVAGGGGGAMGGGGAGGFRIASNLTVSSTGNVSVIVGGGGGFSYQNSFNNLDQPGYNSQIRGGTGGVSSFSANGVVLLQSSGGSGGGAGFGSTAWANNGGSGGGGGLYTGAAFLQTGVILIGSGGSGNTGGYTPAEGYAGGNGGYNTSLTAGNFNASVYGLPYEKAGGGGGGAGGPGSTVVSAAASPTGGAGGPAIYSTFTGANVAYAGGGGGGGGIAGGAGGGAGAGSGAGSNNNNSASGGDALPNTGSGGGGMKFGYPMTSNDTPTGTPTTRSGTGGSGIVIAKLYPTFGLFTGGNLISQTGGVSLYEFTTSNTFVISSNLAMLSNTTVTWETTSLNGTIRGSNYYAIFRAQSQLKLFYQLNSGSFPDGLTFNGQTGELIGIVSANAVTSSFTIKAINVAGASALANFTINVQTTAINLEYLVIGGGGSQYNPPGEQRGGGGGAGGVLSSTISVTGGQVVSVIVGAGGVRSNGGNSTIQSTGISSVTAIGGGMGGAQGTAVSPNGSAGQFGGSGGGGGGAWFNGTTSGTVGPGGTAALGQGSAGGSGSTWTTIGGGESGGGGGAGGSGGTGVVPLGGAATSLYSSWAIDTSTGVSNSYAGGGGGGPTYRNSDAFPGLIAPGGGGGAGDASTFAVANTGSGGRQGGSGLVLIRYPGTPLSIGGNIKVASGYTYHIFRTSGNLVVGTTGPVWSSPDSGILASNLMFNSAFSANLVADGIYLPISYTISSGSLPQGININSSTGVISGTVTSQTTTIYNFTVRATDLAGSVSDRNFVIGTNNALVINFEYLVVAGGGGGGADGNGAGGGGAGGFRTGSFTFTANNSNLSINVVIGAGGPSDTNGQDSTLGSPFSITSTGGGRGARRRAWDGGNGGSGGGGNGWDGEVQLPGLGNTPATDPPQGYNGGTAEGIFFAGEGGGGGGAGGAGQNAQDNANGAGSGGVGRQGLDGVYYAGGGGGGIDTRSAFSPGSGGLGGGGTGAKGVAVFGGTATVNSGGGGGGGSNNSSGGGGGSGGSGIVILRYGGTTARASGGNVTITGGYVYHKFTTSGTLIIIP